MGIIIGNLCMEKYAANFYVKIEPVLFIVLFEIWFYVKPFYYFLLVKVFKGHEKVSKKDMLNFEDMENPFCTNSFFIGFLQNV